MDSKQMPATSDPSLAIREFRRARRSLLPASGAASPDNDVLDAYIRFMDSMWMMWELLVNYRAMRDLGCADTSDPIPSDHDWLSFEGSRYEANGTGSPDAVASAGAGALPLEDAISRIQEALHNAYLEILVEARVPASVPEGSALLHRLDVSLADLRYHLAHDLRNARELEQLRGVVSR